MNNIPPPNFKIEDDDDFAEIACNKLQVLIDMTDSLYDTNSAGFSNSNYKLKPNEVSNIFLQNYHGSQESRSESQFLWD